MVYKQNTPAENEATVARKKIKQQLRNAATRRAKLEVEAAKAAGAARAATGGSGPRSLDSRPLTTRAAGLRAKSLATGVRVLRSNGLGISASVRAAPSAVTKPARLTVPRSGPQPGRTQRVCVVGVAEGAGVAEGVTRDTGTLAVPGAVEVAETAEEALGGHRGRGAVEVAVSAAKLIRKDAPGAMQGRGGVQFAVLAEDVPSFTPARDDEEFAAAAVGGAEGAPGRRADDAPGVLTEEDVKTEGTADPFGFQSMSKSLDAVVEKFMIAGGFKKCKQLYCHGAWQEIWKAR